MNRLPALIFSTLVMAGCKTIRDARDAQRESGEALPPGQRAATAADMGLAPGRALSLSNAVHLALQWNPSMQTAAQSLASAEISLRQAGVTERPTVSSTAAANRSETYTRSTTPDTDDWLKRTSRSVTLGVNVSWVLYDFGYTSAAKRQAAQQFIAASEACRDAGVQLVCQVRNAWFSLARAEALRKVSEESLRQSRLLLEQAELKLEIGTGKKYDVTRARVECGNAALALISAGNAVKTARANLRALMGLAEPVDFEIGSDGSVGSDGFDGSSLENLLAIARENQPSLRIQHAKVAAASAAVDMAIANMYPSLSVSASTSYNNITPQTLTYGFGSSLAQSLFAGWGRTDAVRQNVTALRTARANLAQTEQKLSNDLAIALANLETARESFAVSELLLGQALENLELVTQQFNVGVSSILERTDAQLAHTQAAANFWTSRYALEIAKANLLALLGLVE